MAALVFPSSPTPGQRIPANPGNSGVSQYQWNNTKGVWNTVPTSVTLGTANQNAYNSYEWPLTAGNVGQQLTTDGAGNLTWGVPAAPTLQILTLDRPFNGNPATGVAFTLYETGTTTPFAPNPSDNIIVFLGGVPQIPTAAYTVAGSTITFFEPPLAGTTFYAISSTIV